jgi:hypothetical protein
MVARYDYPKAEQAYLNLGSMLVKRQQQFPQPLANW